MSWSASTLLQCLVLRLLIMHVNMTCFTVFSTYSINDNMFSNSSTVILLYRNAIYLVWTSCFWISYALLFINMYFICLPYHVLFFTLKCCSSGLLQCHLSFPIIHAYVALVFFCMYSASIQFYIQVVFFTLLSRRIRSSYIILSLSGLHVVEMDKTGCI